MGKRERERVKALEAIGRASNRWPKNALDEITQERGVQLVPEGKGKLLS